MFLATCLALRRCALTPWLLFGCLTPSCQSPFMCLIPLVSVNKRLLGCWALAGSSPFPPGH